MFKVPVKKSADEPSSRPVLPVITSVTTPLVCRKYKRKFCTPSQNRYRNVKQKRRALAPLKNISGGVRHKQPDRSNIGRNKSAWTATTLLTVQNVYDTIKTPTIKPTEAAHGYLNFEGVPEGCMPYSPPPAPPQDTDMFGTCSCFVLFCLLVFFFLHYYFYSAKYVRAMCDMQTRRNSE